MKSSLNFRRNQIVVLDVRRLEEYQRGHIPSAWLVPLDQLDQSMPDLPRDREIICVCRSGSRSALAAQRLAAAGFRATNLRGGMLAWNRAGLPLRQA